MIGGRVEKPTKENQDNAGIGHSPVKFPGMGRSGSDSLSIQVRAAPELSPQQPTMPVPARVSHQENLDRAASGFSCSDLSDINLQTSVN